MMNSHMVPCLSHGALQVATSTGDAAARLARLLFEAVSGGAQAATPTDSKRNVQDARAHEPEGRGDDVQ